MHKDKNMIMRLSYAYIQEPERTASGAVQRLAILRRVFLSKCDSGCASAFYPTDYKYECFRCVLRKVHTCCIIKIEWPTCGKLCTALANGKEK